MSEERKAESQATEETSKPEGGAKPAGKRSTGKGLDVGTANLVVAYKDDDGSTRVRQQRNAFLDVNLDNYTRQLLAAQKIHHVMVDEKTYVLGDESFNLANVFNRTTRRPMRDGIIS